MLSMICDGLEDRLVARLVVGLTKAWFLEVPSVGTGEIERTVSSRMSKKTYQVLSVTLTAMCSKGIWSGLDLCRSPAIRSKGRNIHLRPLAFSRVACPSVPTVPFYFQISASSLAQLILNQGVLFSRQLQFASFSQPAGEWVGHYYRQVLITLAKGMRAREILRMPAASELARFHLIGRL